MNAYAHILAQFFTEQQTHAYTQKEPKRIEQNRAEQNTKKMSKEYLQWMNSTEEQDQKKGIAA